MKYIVVHAGRRDDYQVAFALAEAGALHCLVTDFYAPLDGFGMRLVSKILPKKIHSILAKRYKFGLSSSLVVSSLPAIVYAALYSITKNIKYSTLKDQALGVAAQNLSVKHQVPVLSMNTYAKYAFEHNLVKPKVLFQFHPHTKFVTSILTEEMRLNPISQTSLLQEYEFSISSNILNDLAQEIHLADHIICASSVTSHSLQLEGISKTKIEVIPYGVDTTLYPYKKRDLVAHDGVFNVIFIGSLNQRKGITYLLEALDGMPNVVLHVVGRGIFDEQLLNQFKVKIHLHKNIPHEELVSLLHQSHCFILPSLVEGFGQVILEAMATGIPVIASQNTIAFDIIKDGENGFVVPIRDVLAIKERLQLLINQPELVEQIGFKGFQTAKDLNWVAFRTQLVAYLKQLS
jgi:glycosyltransferase involved in cell wall biosynthesis